MQFGDIEPNRFWSEPQSPGSGERLAGPEQPRRPSAPKRSLNPLAPETPVDDDRHGANHPTGVCRRDEILRLRCQHGDAVTRPHTAIDQSVGERRDPLRQGRERQRLNTRHRKRYVGIAFTFDKRIPEPRLFRGGSQRSGIAPWLEHLVEPRVRECGDVFLLDDEVTGEREPMDLGARQPTHQICGERGMKNRIALTPCKQNRHIELAESPRHLGEIVIRRMV